MNPRVIVIAMLLAVVSTFSIRNVAAEESPQLQSYALASTTSSKVFQKILLNSAPKIRLVTDTIGCAEGSTKVSCSDGWRCCVGGGKCQDDLPQCN